ncbi:MAG TPA: PGPGW domain-containing protein [Terriglobia bacterium]|nr:PGPGW domain-containing protein [Terriglobia bacterium]
MAGKFKRSVVLVAGWSLVALGILGLFLPILQGALLLLAGLSVLSSEYVWVHKVLQRLRARFPGLSERLHAAETWVKARFMKVRRSNRRKGE